MKSWPSTWIRPSWPRRRAARRSREGTAAGRADGAAQQPGNFGHNGSNCCIAWADGGRQLVFVYLTDRLTAGHEARHQGEVADAIIAACT